MLCSTKSALITPLLPREEEQIMEKRRVVLLGCGLTGKSTIFTQFKLRYESQTRNEEEDRKLAVDSLVQGTLNLLKDFEEVKLSLPIDLQKKVSKLKDYCKNQQVHDSLSTLRALYSEKSFKEVISKIDRSYYVSHYWQRLNDCSQANWIELYNDFKNDLTWGTFQWKPSPKQFLRFQQRTSGVIESRLVSNSIEYMIYDTGGQRSERRKWYHIKESPIDTLFFVASLSAFDETLYEDNQQNSLEESLEVFKQVCEEFPSKKLVLVLNKLDLFEQKLNKQTPLNISGRFPKAPDTFDVATALNWIKSEYLLKNTTNRDLRVQVITALNDISCLFDEMQELKKNVN